MNEHLILNSWQLNLPPFLTSLSTSLSHKTIPSHWEAPQKGFYKINFDGASKGNPGPTGYGSTIQKRKGEILHIIVVNLGHNTKNSLEIWGLLKGLQASKE
jgi:hypothetical protein